MQEFAGGHSAKAMGSEAQAHGSECTGQSPLPNPVGPGPARGNRTGKHNLWGQEPLVLPVHRLPAAPPAPHVYDLPSPGEEDR